MPTTSTLISVRLSAEALAAIDAAPGRNRTDKLEALVLLHSLELPATLAALAAARKELAEARQALAGAHRARVQLERLEALATQAAAEAGAPDTPPPQRLIDLPPDPATQIDIDYLREDIAELAEAIGHMQRHQGPHRAHRRPPGSAAFSAQSPAERDGVCIIRRFSPGRQDFAPR